jgi:hypothetical protein
MNDAFDTMLTLMGGAQKYPMIAVRNLCDGNDWTHCLFVQTGSNHGMEYIFLVHGQSHTNTLCEARVFHFTFDELLVEMAHAVLHDGQATLIVYPQ